MELQISDSTIAEQNKKICKNCIGFSDCRCYRRPFIELFIFGPRSVDPEGTCFKFESKLYKVR